MPSSECRHGLIANLEGLRWFPQASAPSTLSISALRLCIRWRCKWFAYCLRLGLMIEYHRLGSLNNQFIILLWAGKYKIKGLTDSVLLEGPPSDLQMAAFLVCPHMAESKSSGFSFSSYKGTNLARELYPHDPIYLITSRRPDLQIPSYWGLRFQQTTLEETQTFSS